MKVHLLQVGIFMHKILWDFTDTDYRGSFITHF